MEHNPNLHNLDVAHKGVCTDFGGTNLMDAPSPETLSKYAFTPTVGDQWKDQLRKDAYGIEDVEDFIKWIENHFLKQKVYVGQVLRELIDAINLPEYAGVINFEYAEKTHDASYGGGDCSKHGRYYGVCHSCNRDYKEAKRQADLQVYWKRNDAIREAKNKAVDLLNISKEIYNDRH